MEKNQSIQEAPARLIKVYETYDQESLTDHLLIMAKDIEDALLQAGATPGKDYTYVKLFELAVQFKAPK